MAMLPKRVRDVSPAQNLIDHTLHNGPVPSLPRASPRAVVGMSMVAAVLGRLPSLQWPLRPDEAGFLLVARAWDPQPDSMFGTYWVDRPPPIIALFKLSDWIGGPYFIRVIAALAAALFVLAAAGTARRLAEYAAAPDAERIGAWVAVATAALTSHAAIDSVAAKGEILGLPLVMASCWFSINALMRRSWVLAGAAGTLACWRSGSSRTSSAASSSAACCWSAPSPPRASTAVDFVRLAGAAIAGALLPVLAIVAWCLAVGVHLSTLAYVTLGFRLDASSVLATQPSSTIDYRIRILLLVALVQRPDPADGVVPAPAPPPARAERPSPPLAVAAMLIVDSVGVFVSGSYWRTYLLVPIAPAVLALGLLLADQQHAQPALATLDRLRDPSDRRLHSDQHRAVRHRVGTDRRQLLQGRVPHRAHHRCRRPSPATPWSCTAGERTSSWRAGCRRRTNICGRCPCARSTRTSTSWSPC